MTSPSGPRTPSLYHAEVFSAAAAFGVVLASVATLLVVAVVLGAFGAPTVVAMALGQVAMLAVPLAAMRRARLPLGALGLRRPPLRALAAGVLIGLSLWYVNVRIVHLLPLEHADLPVLQSLVERPSLVLVLATVALAPAVCEEIVFRGVLARGLAARFGLPLAVAGSAALFSVYHLNPLQMLPTFTLGLALGLVATRANSAVPAIVGHFLNNACAVAIARGELPDVARAVTAHPNAALAGCVVATATGVALVAVRPA